MIYEVRCSSLDRVLGCNASIRIEDVINRITLDAFDDGDGHAVQWAGSWCHHTAAKRLVDLGALGEPDSIDHIPTTFEPSGYDHWVAQWFVEKTIRSIPNDWAVYVERYLEWIFPLDMPFVIGGVTYTHLKLTGHIDVSGISRDGINAIIRDLKRGYDIVDEAEFNWQLAGYGVLMKQAHPMLNHLDLFIDQPANPDRTTKASVDDLEKLTAYLQSEINKALQNSFTTNTGKACKYCKGLEVCPTFRKEVLTMRETLTPEYISSLSGICSTKELAELAAHARKIQYPIKRILDLLKDRLIEEGPVVLDSGETCAVIEEEGDRRIDDVRFAHEALSSKVGVTNAWTACSMSITKVTEALAASGMKKTSKKEESAESWIRETLGGVIVRDPSKRLVIK